MIVNDEYVPRWAFLKARELLALDVDLGEISRELQLSRKTVAGIAAGTVGHSHLVIERDDPQGEAMQRSRRCRGCGGMVYIWPCLVCQIRQSPPDSARKKNRLSGETLLFKRRRVRRAQRRSA